MYGLIQPFMLNKGRGSSCRLEERCLTFLLSLTTEPHLHILNQLGIPMAGSARLILIYSEKDMIVAGSGARNLGPLGDNRCVPGCVAAAVDHQASRRSTQLPSVL
jgi:hypothetical protein